MFGVNRNMEALRETEKEKWLRIRNEYFDMTVERELRRLYPSMYTWEYSTRPSNVRDSSSRVTCVVNFLNKESRIVAINMTSLLDCKAAKQDVEEFEESKGLTGILLERILSQVKASDALSGMNEFNVQEYDSKTVLDVKEKLTSKFGYRAIVNMDYSRMKVWN